MEPWLIGMQLAMLGCFCSAVGLVLLKHSTNVESTKPLYQRRFWLLGFLFLVVNASVIDIFAFSLAPITLIAPFTGVTIVFTSWLATTFLKETLDAWDATSTGITLAGVTITSIYGVRLRACPKRPERARAAECLQADRARTRARTHTARLSLADVGPS
jgi:multidrug transporter EmrE-like cation transporter